MKLVGKRKKNFNIDIILVTLMHRFFCLKRVVFLDLIFEFYFNDYVKKLFYCNIYIYIYIYIYRNKITVGY